MGRFRRKFYGSSGGGGGGGGVGLDPLDASLASKLLGYWKAEDLDATYAEAAGITGNWADASGHGKVMIPRPSSGHYPLMRKNKWGTFSAISILDDGNFVNRFDSGTATLDPAGAALDALVLTIPRHTDLRIVFEADTGASPTRYWTLQSNGGGCQGICNTGAGDTSKATTRTTAPSPKPLLLRGTYDPSLGAGEVKVQADRFPEEASASGANTNAMPARIASLGGRITTGGEYYGYIFCALLAAGLTDSERAGIVAFLLDKYKI